MYKFRLLSCFHQILKKKIKESTFCRGFLMPISFTRESGTLALALKFEMALLLICRFLVFLIDQATPLFYSIALDRSFSIFFLNNPCNGLVSHGADYYFF